MNPPPTRHPVLLLLLAVLLAVGVVRPGAADELADVLHRHRVRPVMPPSAAVDFALEDLSGAEVSLRDHQGRWGLLTIWATWCGPCLTELPSLQRFWEVNADQGFSVLAVAVGSEAGAVQSVVKRNGLTFPVLIDAGDRVAARYQAWSVPLTYLVDPAGRLVGVVQGARDWSATAALVADLHALGLASGEGLPPEPEPARQAVVELPPDLVPPTATVATIGDRPMAGEPFTLQVTVRWADAGEDYRIHAPVLTLPEGLSQEAVSASSSSADGLRVLTYAISLVPAQAGTFHIDPVEIRFTPRGGSEPLATRVTGPTVEVSAAHRGMLAWLLGVAAGAALAGIVVWRRSRSRGET